MPTNDTQLNNTTTVYVANFDANITVDDVVPAIRNEFIQRCADLKTRQQRYCVWRLLDYALRKNSGKGVDGFHFTVSDNGKWSCNDGVNFSLTHCNNVVAVALSNNDVGIDIEAVANFARHVSDNLYKRVLTDSEQSMLRNAPVERHAQILAQIWTQKESIFKLQGDSAFIPKLIDSTKFVSNSRLLMLDDEQYALSVATAIPSEINLEQVISLR